MHSTNVSRNSRRLAVAMFILRIALAAAFLSAVADRFGLWGAPGTHGVSWGHLARFNAYVRKLIWFLPASIIPAVGWIATMLETLLGLSLVAGWRIRWISLASALLLLSFAGTMLIALGPRHHLTPRSSPRQPLLFCFSRLPRQQALVKVISASIRLGRLGLPYETIGRRQGGRTLAQNEITLSMGLFVAGRAIQRYDSRGVAVVVV